ncbi:MAG TPA: ABC transporter ATP-binding protein [Verrucomicrobiae bacterium]|jgi:phospholipid/cholesterol/gamma-HCH transport system ATP-binding protein|nr:ABC transporter ATP-binding protein [Verrucomicrobiae bacterium]
MIETRHLRKTFKSQIVLDDVNIQIENGASVAIIGRSGGGKSVLLKHLIGLLQPDSGEVLIDGENIVGMDERQLLRVRRQFGMVFQNAALFDSMSVAENIAFGLRRHEHLTEGEIARKVCFALEVVDLPGIQHKQPAELSGGMRKRVGLARAIVYEPRIVLYDEPTTGLDPIVSDSIDELMMGVRDRLHVTTVVVTHDMRTARRLGQHIMLLHRGNIHANGPPDVIFNSQDPIIRQFVDGIADSKETLLMQSELPTAFIRKVG